MHTLKTTTIVSAALFTLLLSACGGSGSPMNNNNGGGGGGGGVDTTTAQKIGAGTGDSFSNGVIGVSNSITELSAGGTTTLEVYVVSSTNTPVVTTSTITFISSCISANKAILKNAAGTVASSTTTINGRATMVYTANGCVGTDRVTASTTINGATAYANVDLEIEAGTVGSIEFTSVTPDNISLKGSGGNETSVVLFQVKDGSGAPVGNTAVTFEMSTTAGGMDFSPKTTLSDSNGYVRTTVSSGTVPTDVSVTATVNGSNISTTSRILKVSTGVPVQRSASLSATEFNSPSWLTDGIEVDVTMRMADDFGNPVIDGTAVTFWAEGGAIQPNCTTENGECSVTWRSQASRPVDGRVTILAFTSGNESFVDANSNGQYDAGETFTDMAEAFLDSNENGIHDNGNELFVNLEGGTVGLDAGDGKYSGTLCKTDDTNICTKEKVIVRKSWALAMSSPYGIFELFSDDVCRTSSTGIISGTVGKIYIKASDENGNSLPSGTTVSIDTSKTVNLVVDELETEVPNTPNAMCLGVDVNGAIGSTGSFQITSETTDGVTSRQTFTITFQ